MKNLKDWVRVPTFWLRNKETPLLRSFSWSNGDGGDHIAALMLYIALNQQTPNKEIKVRLTYEQLCLITSLSRAKVSAGIQFLEKICLIQIEKKGRSNIYNIVNRDAKDGWGKLPTNKLYDDDGQIEPFKTFKLRAKTELNALKIYLLIIAFRNNKVNYTIISYEKICEYTGVSERYIRSALSLLINLKMINVDKKLMDDNKEKRINVYWLCGLSHHHAGNSPDQQPLWSNL